MSGVGIKPDADGKPDYVPHQRRDEAASALGITVGIFDRLGWLNQPPSGKKPPRKPAARRRKKR